MIVPYSRLDMRSLQDEIRKAQQELTCPVCGRMFELRDINIRAYEFNKAVELSVTCNRGHFPIILLIPLTLKEIAKAGQISSAELKAVFTKINYIKESIHEILD